ncbi:hypothetical protein [Sphingomonas glacialis]|uniref:hypothetical protein n=1 Tax=Sphingomonas glacialis TaxID=658225 RepID=UPI00112E5064|nr:hypothetical protein [Sphingomonas glacialis]
MRERTIAREARSSASLFPNSSDAQAAAAWVAVHEARRGISAAWFAAVINILVITTAFGVPYLTKYLADEDRRSDVHDAKMLLMPRLTNLLEALEASHVFDDGGLPDVNIPPNQRRDRMESLEEDMSRSDKRREDLYRLMARFSTDKDIYKFLDVMEEAEGAFYATIASIRDRLKWSSLYVDKSGADDGRDLRPSVPPIDRRPALRLLIDLNTEGNGDVAPGPMLYESCDDIAYANKCMTYLSAYHEGEPKCFGLSCTMLDGRKVTIDKAFGQTKPKNANKQRIELMDSYRRMMKQ